MEANKNKIPLIEGLKTFHQLEEHEQDETLNQSIAYIEKTEGCEKFENPVKMELSMHDDFTVSEVCNVIGKFDGMYLAECNVGLDLYTYARPVQPSSFQKWYLETRGSVGRDACVDYRYVPELYEEYQKYLNAFKPF